MKRPATFQSVPPALPHPRQRSAVTNGTRMFIDGDEGSPFARRFRDIIALHIADLGGLDAVSQAQRGLCRHAAGLQIMLEGIEAAMSRGEAVDLRGYDGAGKSLVRLLKTLGLKREVPARNWRDALNDARARAAGP